MYKIALKVKNLFENKLRFIYLANGKLC